MFSGDDLGIIMIFGPKTEKVRETFRIFFVSAEISAPRSRKTTFVEKIKKTNFAKLMDGYSLKVSKFPLHTKKVIFDRGFQSKNSNGISFGSPCEY